MRELPTEGWLSAQQHTYKSAIYIAFQRIV